MSIVTPGFVFHKVIVFIFGFLLCIFSNISSRVRAANQGGRYSPVKASPWPSTACKQLQSWDSSFQLSQAKQVYCSLLSDTSDLTFLPVEGFLVAKQNEINTVLLTIQCNKFAPDDSF